MLPNEYATVSWTTGLGDPNVRDPEQLNIGRLGIREEYRCVGS